jgi:Ca2+-dependent lipid-binding protein
MGIMSFTVVAASGLRAADVEGTSDPYCVCKVGSESVRTTTKMRT